jgi:hypothetical protein
MPPDRTHKRLLLLPPPRLWIVHRLDPRITLYRDDAYRLRTALVKLARRRRLVRRAAAHVRCEPALSRQCREQPRVCELYDHLRPPVGRHTERLDRALAIRGQVEPDRLRADKRHGCSGRGVDRVYERRRDGPVHRFRRRRGGGGSGRWGTVIERRIGDHGEHVIAHAARGRAVHEGVLAHEARARVVEDDELYGLVAPSVHEPGCCRAGRGRDVAMPEAARVVNGTGGHGRVEGESECGRVDGIDDLGVIGIAAKGFVILDDDNMRKDGEWDGVGANLGPGVSVGGGEDAYTGIFFRGVVINVLKLSVDSCK